jgi:hypothetical protein
MADVLGSWDEANTAFINLYIANFCGGNKTFGLHDSLNEFRKWGLIMRWYPANFWSGISTSSCRTVANYWGGAIKLYIYFFLSSEFLKREKHSYPMWSYCRILKRDLRSRHIFAVLKIPAVWITYPPYVTDFENYWVENYTVAMRKFRMCELRCRQTGLSCWVGSSETSHLYVLRVSEVGLPLSQFKGSCTYFWDHSRHTELSCEFLRCKKYSYHARILS